MAQSPELNSTLGLLGHWAKGPDGFPRRSTVSPARFGSWSGCFEPWALCPLSASLVHCSPCPVSGHKFTLELQRLFHLTATPPSPAHFMQRCQLCPKPAEVPFNCIPTERLHNARPPLLRKLCRAAGIWAMWKAPRCLMCNDANLEHCTKSQIATQRMDLKTGLSQDGIGFCMHCFV